jgi:ATP-dependent protease ClpP protease subunit
MKRLLTVLAIVAKLFLSATPALALQTLPVLDPNRTVAIDAPIMPNSLGGINDALLTMAAKSKAPVNVILDTPGGSVYEGYKFLRHLKQLKADGIKVRCIVSGNAMSMGMMILLECSERYAVEGALVMWHFPRAGVQGSADELLKAAIEIKELELKGLARLKEVLPLTPEEVEERYYAEKIQEADTLHKETMGKFFVAVPEAIPGLLQVLKHPAVVHPKTMSLLDLLRGALGDKLNEPAKAPTVPSVPNKK